MFEWSSLLKEIEALEELALDPELVGVMQRTYSPRPITFHTPTFKTYSTSEIASCNQGKWPAISITGRECKLKCDHCKARILETMIAARDPSELWEAAAGLAEQGAQGMLLTGGSNHRNEVEYVPYFPVIRRLKERYPCFQVAVHTGLVDAEAAQGLERAGVDVAMLDLIGAQETVERVYHLKRPVSDFEASLAFLSATRMRVVPHIVIGLHYGELRGESAALAMAGRHRVDGLVLVVIMPHFADPRRPFRTPEVDAVGRFFLEARAALPERPLFLGCARPAGSDKTAIDAYAVMAGLDGIAHPSEGIVTLARRMGRASEVTASCCSIGCGGGSSPKPGMPAAGPPPSIL